MSDELTVAGLQIDSLEDRLEAVCGLLRAAIASNLDLTPDQPTGQLVRILVERTQSVLEVVRAVHAGGDPLTATGQALTALCYLTGTQRRAATYGHVTLSVNLDGGVTLPAGSVAHVAGDAENRWATDVDVTAPAGPPAAYNVAATCEASGPIQALLGTITVIATPVVGWNSVTNAADAAEGDAEETDADLRERRELELALGGSTTIDAIRAELIALTGMIEAIVIENDAHYVVDGMPPHSIECIIWDGSPAAVADADIAETIWTSKSAGVYAWGLTDTANHTDDQGGIHVVAWTRATPLQILVEVTVTTDATYLGAAAIQDYIEAQAATFFSCGVDVFRSRIIDWTMEVQGVVDVSLVELAISPAVVAAVDIPVDIREIATIAAGDVVVW